MTKRIALGPYSPNVLEGRFCELRRDRVLRRLMCNSEKRGRRPNLMLTPFLDQKAVLAYGPRLLPRLIVRPHRKLVEGHPRPRRREGRPPIAHQRPGDPHTGDPRPMAALAQREGLSQIRRGAFARVFPHAPLPKPVQPQGEGFGGRGEGALAPSCPNPRRGGHRLPRPRYDPHPRGGEGQGMPEGAFRRTGHLREERLEEGAPRRPSGSTASRSASRSLRRVL